MAIDALHKQGFMDAVIEEAPQARSRFRGKIAAFLDSKTVAINRGDREGVKVGDLYAILNNDVNGDQVALLRAVEVREKMTLARSIWCLPRVPTLKIGWNVFRVDLAGNILSALNK